MGKQKNAITAQNKRHHTRYRVTSIHAEQKNNQGSRTIQNGHVYVMDVKWWKALSLRQKVPVCAWYRGTSCSHSRCRYLGMLLEQSVCLLATCHADPTRFT